MLQFFVSNRSPKENAGYVDCDLMQPWKKSDLIWVGCSRDLDDEQTGKYIAFLYVNDEEKEIINFDLGNYKHTVHFFNYKAVMKGDFIKVIIKNSNDETVYEKIQTIV